VIDRAVIMYRLRCRQVGKLTL